MSDKEQKKLDMYDAVLSLLSDNKEIISNIPALVSAISRFRKVIDEIRREERAISSEAFEITIQTSKLKDELIFSLVPVASALFNYARENGDLKLKEKCRITQSNFVRMLDRDLLEKAEVLRILAKENIHKLKKYNVSAQRLSELQEKMALYRASLGSKVASFVSTSTMTPLQELFNDADRILSKYMDNYIESLNGNYAEFYDEYLWTRDTENQDAVKVMMEMEEENESEE
ncbi:MAG: hypothetical protein HF300_14025 [Ignavibacteria bacterium]|jgi:aldehyde:ferredoxin oxidoreductase|nr:hypothetical protein [Ignavibacteria bacterium]MCU7500269.1 hypothetical protein [Ignavibacteria bacterium]MCU7513678.1 hypothetical protein [Ignavibacteria bacterium]MCU7520653.1 hypothetical protein [Ignavibacteria bacterium]MCU7523551.1 hypothetical protein [Ignavibacteria bacterium]